VPAAFGVVWRLGQEGDVERFWLTVLLAGFGCYGTLPWLAARPPRLMESAPSRPSGLASFTDRLLARVSHRMTTFPSGHMAVAVAAALAVVPVSVPAAAVLGVVSAGIAAGAVAGRYHFAVDVVLGAVVGLAAALVSSGPFGR
jgi:membrane-associated phospholipid phosphatase